MSKPFDTTTKELLEGFPESWMAYLGLTPDGPIHAIDSNLSTLPAEADKVFQVDGPAPYLVHVEMQAGQDRSLPRRPLAIRNALPLDLRHDLRILGSSCSGGHRPTPTIDRAARPPAPRRPTRRRIPL